MDTYTECEFSDKKPSCS